LDGTDLLFYFLGLPRLLVEFYFMVQPDFYSKFILWNNTPDSVICRSFFTPHNRPNGFRNCFSPQTAIKRAQNAYARKATKKQLQRNALAATSRTPAKKTSLT
jgi:hypothetical protein